MNNHYRSHTKQRGVAAIEAVITLPFLILVMLLVMDFGRVMYVSITTTSAARAAAGYAAQSTNLVVDTSGIQASAQQEANDLLINNANEQAVDVSSKRICKCPGSITEVSCTSNLCAAELQIFIEVTASRDFRTVVEYPFIPNDIPISRTAIIRAQ
ncbi:TadE-like protein [Shewanella piezotolerans WP3]|uniref:TadE-like protein n=1 Tax=Shewanella piezotolerans (strain WP3 / JCM 13877) TaxID=225849 RepID=B8CHX5_SHEPW|nr:TadE family protein [Shewanella piezotolerans]ACJ27251.1 TadE-like protein [Shewanella piezotolerans WP3]